MCALCMDLCQSEVKIGKVELHNMKDSYLVRKDQRYQGRNPQRKQEKAEVKIGKVELQNMKDSYLVRKD